jgi:dTDP-L-rhamnose 4-epimerase
MPDLADSTVLVTGGAGFIGCALSRRLAATAGRWVVLDSLHPQVHARQERPAELAAEAEFHHGDVTDPAAWETLLADVRPDVVVHLAAETGTAQSLSESTRHGHTNVVGTTVMLDALTAVDHVPSHFVLTSSRAVYGEGLWLDADGNAHQPEPRTHAQLARGEWDFPGLTHQPTAATTTPPSPSSIYGATKLAQEHILRAWTGSRESKVSILRLQNVYGPGQSLTNPYTGIVSLFSQLARRGDAIPLYEDGLITRDFILIDDIASALAAAIAQPPSAVSRTVDVGTGLKTTIRDLAEAIARYYDAPAPVVTGQFRDGDVRHASCDITATTQELGWRPEWSLDAGVAALQDWITAQLDA